MRNGSVCGSNENGLENKKMSMIILGVFSDPYKNVFIVDGKIKSLELKNYNGENNSEIVEQVDDETVIGLCIDNAVLYL